jgi:hypothetical protein
MPLLKGLRQSECGRPNPAQGVHESPLAVLLNCRCWVLRMRSELGGGTGCGQLPDVGSAPWPGVNLEAPDIANPLSLSPSGSRLLQKDATLGMLARSLIRVRAILVDREQAWERWTSILQHCERYGAGTGISHQSRSAANPVIVCLSVCISRIPVLNALARVQQAHCQSEEITPNGQGKARERKGMSRRLRFTPQSPTRCGCHASAG